ncbi:MAG: cytochrome c [Burkholderiaceae bacterium]|jgi:cytochrome c55X|nr:cytochrome c [Burkholderiaceae bacterium]
MLLSMWIPAALLAAAGLSAAQAGESPQGTRQMELVRLVRQDCGSCHGMRLTGGLGPALTREALAEKPIESLAATIYGGRPGTPMPGWRAMISEDEAHWIARQLVLGFPEESGLSLKAPR